MVFRLSLHQGLWKGGHVYTSRKEVVDLPYEKETDAFWHVHSLLSALM
jgi:hypothetical protein